MSEQLSHSNHSLQELSEQPHLSLQSRNSKGQDQEQKLIANSSIQPNDIVQNKKIESNQVQIIDPFRQLYQNNNVIPLLVVIDKIDISQIYQGKPLINKLCTMNIPLATHLKGKQIEFKKDSDNRTALHQSIAADDILSTYWCLQNNIQNSKDNYGYTPLGQAIKYGRRNHFLLLLRYRFYDPEAPHICAIFNRAWQMKVLHSLGYDILSTRDSYHFSPIQRAVENYSFQVAQFLTQLNPSFDIQNLKSKTDSKGIILTIKNTKKINSLLFTTIIPIFYPIFNLIILNIFSKNIHYLKSISTQCYYITIALTLLYMLLVLMGNSSQQQHKIVPDFLDLLGAPKFPPMQSICPLCLKKQKPLHEHCTKCRQCVSRFHFHNFICVNKNNEVFWFLIQIFWFVIIYIFLDTFVVSIKLNNILISNFSSSIFFQFTAIVEMLYNQNKIYLLAFLYLYIFRIYQFCCLYQWFTMMVLNRSYREVNHSQRYGRLYRIVKLKDGNYKSQEIKLMQNGLIGCIIQGTLNFLKYFVRD